MEIKIVPDAFAASELMWLLSPSTRVSRVRDLDGGDVLYIQGRNDSRHLVDQIRNRAALHGVAPVVVHVGDALQSQVTEFGSGRPERRRR
jgi:hypothetical protein